MRLSNRQNGVVLILVLIFLVVLSVAALAALRLSTLEARLSAGFSERSRAQQQAEAALVQAENWLAGAGLSVQSDGRLCTSGGDCFSAQCTQGLCFTGQYHLIEDAPDDCTLSATAAPDTVFQNRTLWNDPGKTQLWIANDTSQASDDSTRMLIEWRCFVPLDAFDPDGYADQRFQPAHWAPLLRISAYHAGQQGQARRLVQSLYSPALGRLSWRAVPILFER